MKQQYTCIYIYIYMYIYVCVCVCVYIHAVTNKTKSYTAANYEFC